MKVIIVLFSLVVMAQSDTLTLTVTHKPSGHTIPTNLVFSDKQYIEFEEDSNIRGYGIRIKQLASSLSYPDLQLTNIKLHGAKFSNDFGEYILRDASLQLVKEKHVGNEIELSVIHHRTTDIELILKTKPGGEGYKKEAPMAFLQYSTADLA